MVVKHYLDFLPDGFWSIQLDIVGFLAILGEASVLANSQVAAMSKTCLLPRLIPAPQALIRTSRPERLHTSTGTIIGFESGNVRRHINHIPHILHQVAFHEHGLGSAELEQYQVRAIEIKWAPEVPKQERNIFDAIDKAQSRSKAGNKKSNADKAAGKDKHMNSPFKHRSWSRQWGPLVWLAYGGCAQSIALLLVSATQGDGMSLLAVILLSLVSTLVGWATHCELKLPSRQADRDVPPSDVVISYPNGSLLIVKCPEDIARLYVQSEQCEYFVKSVWQYRVICLVASVLLMFGVIALANAQPLLQVIWAGAYIVLNAFYWIVAALPARWHWDMTSFETTVQHFDWWQMEKHADGTKKLVPKTDNDPGRTFTDVLWNTIAITESTRWARIGEVAPNTRGWDNWLEEAWRAVKRYNATTRRPVKSDDDRDSTDDVVKTAPEVRLSHAPVQDLEGQRHAHGKIPRLPNPPRLQLPKWDYSEALTRRLKEYEEDRKRDSTHF